MSTPRKRLGRGLDGLLPAAPVATPVARIEPKASDTAALEELHPSRAQPRSFFDPEGLAELAASIQEHGMLEPILVRKRDAGGYQIIAGERRWRAAQQAGLREVPIFVRELSDAVAFEAALVENIQREDLDPIETAKAFQRLIDEYGHTQEAVATRVGKDRSTVTNALRLLKLPDSVLALVEAGDLSEGHGRALLSAKDQKSLLRLAKETCVQGWSVRELERQARESKGSSTSRPSAPSKAVEKSANVRALERRLSQALGLAVSVDEKSKGKGRISIRYSSYEELDRLIDRLD